MCGRQGLQHRPVLQQAKWRSSGQTQCYTENPFHFRPFVMKPTALIWQLRKILPLGITTMGNVMAGSAVRSLGAAPRASIFHWEVTSPKWSPREKWNF